MQTAFTKLFLLIATVLFGVSCSTYTIKGNGILKQKEFLLPQEINELEIGNGWNVKLIKGSENKLIVNTDENILELFKYEFKEHNLNISALKKQGLIKATKRNITIYYTSNIDDIDVSSGASLSSKDILNQRKLTLDISSGADIILELKTQYTSVEASSGANINLEGTIENLKAEASSGATIKGKKLETQTLDAEASSGGNIKIGKVHDKIKASASAGGNIKYGGNPKKTEIEKSISGNISKF